MKKMTREKVVEALVEQDIEDIRQEIYHEECAFLTNVLTGEGWKPYNQLSDKELEDEYNDRLLSDEETHIKIK